MTTLRGKARAVKATEPPTKLRTEVDADASSRLVTYREAADLCDEETIRRVLSHNKHYHTDGRRPRPFWFETDFEELLDLVEIETNRGGLS